MFRWGILAWWLACLDGGGVRCRMPVPYVGSRAPCLSCPDVGLCAPHTIFVFTVLQWFKRSIFSALPSSVNTASFWRHRFQ